MDALSFLQFEAHFSSPGVIAAYDELGFRDAWKKVVPGRERAYVEAVAV